MDVARPRARLSRRLVVLLVAVAAVVVVAVAWRATARASASAAHRVDRASIWTGRVARGDLIRQVAVHGTLVPEHVTFLSASSPGQVAKLAVQPGAEVEPDTVVVVLANADLELAALEAERMAASAQAALIQLDVRTDAETKVAATALSALRGELADAERHASAADRLAGEGLMSALDRDHAANKSTTLGERISGETAHVRVLDAGRGRQLAAQRAELERLREIAAFARRRLGSLEVRAGTRGVVQDLPLEHGQWVAVGATLAKIAEPGRLKADVRVSEAEARDVHRGLPVRFESGSRGVFRGRVERVDPAAARGSVRLEVSIEDALPPGARADESVSGWVEIEKLDNVLFVTRPAGALDGAPTSVFRMDADGVHASRVTVRFGRGSAREVDVLAGLAEGDEIIVSDVSTPDGTQRLRLE